MTPAARFDNVRAGCPRSRSWDVENKEGQVLRRIVVLGAALAVAMAAVASAASSGLYTGRTSQKLKITVKVSGGKVVKVDYAAVYSSCNELINTDKVKIAIRSNKFSATVHPNSETIDKLSGAFKGQKVSGAITSTVTTGGIHPMTCRSGKVTFSATR